MKAFKHLGFVILFSANADASLLLSENFDNISTLPGSGWVLTNNSSPAGTTSWFQGNTAVFNAQAGAADSYVAANFNNADFGGTISNWLLTPSLTFNNGDLITFYTRSAATLPDRLEVRLSGNGSGSDVGATATSVGDFTTSLLAINPTLANNGYPSDWTLETIILSGLGGPVTGRIGFRYFISDTSINGDYIGIDNLTITSSDQGAIPELGTLPYLCVGLVYLFRRRPSMALPSKHA